MASNPLKNIPVVVKNLIIINVLVYLAQLAAPAVGFNFTEYFSEFFWRGELFRPHQLVTSIFLHDPNDFSHLAFNMFGLFIFGRVLEDVMGSKKFLMYYIICGVGANLLSLISKEIQFQYLAAQIEPALLDNILNDGINLYNKGMVY